MNHPDSSIFFYRTSRGGPGWPG